MAALRVVKGTHDLFPADVARYQRVASVFQQVAVSMGFGEIRTPVIEHLGVFQRTLGTQSDIVSKEMFLLRSRADTDPICLRPEATACEKAKRDAAELSGTRFAFERLCCCCAAVARAVATAPRQSLVSKLFYSGPMFRLAGFCQPPFHAVMRL
jgi:histidyl-tRNA synthetase